MAFTCHLLLCTPIVALHAQGNIQTDRPDRTESPWTVAPASLQFEFGLTYDRVGATHSVTHPELLLRYGLAGRVEFRIATALRTISWFLESHTGIDPVELGAKLRILDESAFLPATAVIANVAVPALSSRVFRPSHPGGELLVAWAHGIGETADAGANVGAAWDGTNPRPVYTATLTVGFDASERLSCFVEWFASFDASDGPVHSVDAGFAFLLSPDIQLDLAFGGAPFTAGSDAFAGCGFSFRLPIGSH